MNKILLLVGAIVHCTALIAQYPANLHNQDLRVWLKSNLYDSQFDGVGYDSAREQMYSVVDNVNGQVSCIYTGFSQAAEFTTFLDPINAEHIVPQSFYGGSSPMRSDIHNIRPAHESANSARGFLDFGELSDSQATWYGVNQSGIYVSQSNTPSNLDDFSEGSASLWEPKEDSKGNIARHLMYFYTVYPTEAGSITDLISLNTLYDWHLSDPADSQEIIRNNRIEEIQGNRNPYVDYPELAYDAWLWTEILGCTDSNASNFNPNANTDDGSCTYIIPGCTDAEATNYDPNATEDDGSCVFESASSFLGLSYEVMAETGLGTTVRIYANFSDPTHELITVYGSDDYPLSISTLGAFYQDEEGGPTSDDIRTDDFQEFPDLNFDSWVTVGEDEGPNSLNVIGVDFTGFENGNALEINSMTGGGWFILGGTVPSAFPDSEGRVLIAQLTATDDIIISARIQSRNQQFIGFYDSASLTIPITTALVNCNHPLSYNYNSTSVNSIPCDPYCQGDFNGDRLVDVNDFLIFLPVFNTSCD